ncbi:MAG: DUF4287 domain-containing protein [Hyphomonadaceae bacterium]
MALDRSKLHKGFTSYLNNAEQSSGKTYEDFALVLSKSGLKSHGDLRAHLMDKFGLGHGHANAVVHIWREFDGGDALIGSAAAKTTAKKAPAKATVKKAAKTPAKKVATKAPAKKK